MRLLDTHDENKSDDEDNVLEDGNVQEDGLSFRHQKASKLRKTKLDKC